MSNSLEQKLKKARLAEGMTQKALSEATGIPLGTIKNYEAGHNAVGLQVLLTLTMHPTFRKYSLWLLTGDTAPQAGQCAPEEKRPRSRTKAG
ncbi:TPA: helix-turn-helix transcriptional regulator [Enterobacter asburiae]|nr:helix-turn-helix transcriptional regulator [Enterobacter asburiae]